MNKMFKTNSEKLNPTIFFKFISKEDQYINVDCIYIILGKATILILSYGVFYSAV